MKKGKVLVLGATGNLGAYSAVALKNVGYDVIATGKSLNYSYYPKL